MVGIADLPDEDPVAEDRHLMTRAPLSPAEQLDGSTFSLDRAHLANRRDGDLVSEAQGVPVSCRCVGSARPDQVCSEGPGYKGAGQQRCGENMASSHATNATA